MTVHFHRDILFNVNRTQSTFFQVTRKEKVGGGGGGGFGPEGGGCYSSLRLFCSKACLGPSQAVRGINGRY